MEISYRRGTLESLWLMETKQYFLKTALITTLALYTPAMMVSRCAGQTPAAKTASEKAAEARKAFQEGMRLARQGRYQKAVASFDQSIRLTPGDAKAYYNRGLAYYELRQIERALRDYSNAIHLHPVDADFYNSRGLAYRYL